MVGDDRYLDSYRSLSDVKLRMLAQHEFEDLVPEAQTALMQVIRERGLDKKVEEYREAERNPISPEEIGQFAANRHNLPCPHCGVRDGSFNVYPIFQFVFCYVFFYWRYRLLVGCRNCILGDLNGLRTTYLILAVLVPIQTLISLGYLVMINRLRRKIETENSPTPSLLPYVERHYWEIKGSA